MKLLLIVLPLLALAPAIAVAGETPYRIAVPYNDLNLHSEAGVKALDRRLERAVRTVCREFEGSVIPEHRFAAQRCLDEKTAEVTALRDRAIADDTATQKLASH